MACILTLAVIRYLSSASPQDCGQKKERETSSRKRERDAEQFRDMCPRLFFRTNAILHHRFTHLTYLPHSFSYLLSFFLSLSLSLSLQELIVRLSLSLSSQAKELKQSQALCFSCLPIWPLMSSVVLALVFVRERLCAKLSLPTKDNPTGTLPFSFLSFCPLSL